MIKLFLSNFKPIQKLIVVSCLSAPLFTSAQSTLFTDTANRRIVQTECNDRVFTKVEVIPSVQGGVSALADSLARYCKERKVAVKGQAVFAFLVTKSSGIIGIEKLSGRLSSEETIKEALKVYSGMWTPALQNKYIVCAVVRLRLESDKEKIILTIEPQQ